MFSANIHPVHAPVKFFTVKLNNVGIVSKAVISQYVYGLAVKELVALIYSGLAGCRELVMPINPSPVS